MSLLLPKNHGVLGINAREQKIRRSNYSGFVSIEFEAVHLQKSVAKLNEMLALLE